MPDLREWPAERLARYQLPTEVKVVAELPRTPSMKVGRPAVRALFDEAGDTSGTTA